MSIKVNHLSRQYGQQMAVNDISFEVNEGEIVGFLGPNGAGKSTTMKIITGFLPPTTGTALVGGKSITDHPLAVKKKSWVFARAQPVVPGHVRARIPGLHSRYFWTVLIFKEESRIRDGSRLWTNR